MKRLLALLKRWSGAEPERARLSKNAAIEIAQQHLGAGEPLVRPGASVRRVGGGPLVWHVVTHIGDRGAHSQIDVDDETGAVVRVHHVEY